MEKLKLSYNLAKKAVTTLGESLLVLDEAKHTKNPRLILAAQDSIIQRFEYSYDSMWKFLKRYLEIKYNIIDVNSPRAVFRACTERDICSTTDTDIFIAMIEDRNETTHNYDAEEVREILPNIPVYYYHMDRLLTHLNAQL